MLCLQGTRDTPASMDLLVPLIGRLGRSATLSTLEKADRSFHVPVRPVKTDEQVMGEMLDAMAQWIASPS